MEYDIEEYNSPISLDEKQLLEASEVVAAAFGRENDAENHRDTRAHACGAKCLQLVYADEKMVGFAAFNELAEPAAVELSGITIHPEFQKHHIGSEIVKQYLKSSEAEQLAVYTRNPAILKIVGEVAGRDSVLVYDSPEVVVDLLPNAVLMEDGVIYDIGRYPGGLFGSFDPAEQDYNGQPLKTSCLYLDSPENALAVAVKIDRGRL
jgi:hypothetical protein